MTTITVTVRAEDVTFRARGHAEGDPAACAAVSALLWALAGYLDHHGGGCGQVGKGTAFLRVGRGTQAEHAAECILVGLLQVERAAPHDVAVKVTPEA